ncbi:hypothetical protein ETAA8_57390 [Anatilimnocola aggregata]|uniref:Nucleotidyl transferase AbiEii/AbiGii toxin family protein n=1 Tax=Anatilimnocola aggregata TaxID=2528021 RepID=A0A517YK49_9BACT|nr:nucleotidyl transferase AbiEii/AbiGii toxin family protein [Anatilimnocola aggregata]QDU30593.1 hypothetical protein ETAA8_57390 [Anatilimnocola aggregata]
MAKKVSTSELDFIRKIKSIALKSLFSDDTILENLVLKGGNALDLGLNVSTRSSLDLDLSMDEQFETNDEFRERIQRAIEDGFAREKYRVIDFNFRAVPRGVEEDPELIEFWGGYSVDFKIISAEDYERLKGNEEQIRRECEKVGSNGSTKFEIDISKHEYNKSRKFVVFEGLKIAIYTPAALVAEKIRAICQQMPEYGLIVKRSRGAGARPKDFTDIYVICNHPEFGLEVDFGSAEFHSLVQKMFEAKRVPLDWIGKIKDTFDVHVLAFPSVLDTILPGVELPSNDFELYFAFVVEKCRQLEPLWNK